MSVEDAFLSESSKVNHDLNFLYLIARTQLSKEMLETLMYGSDFEEPTEEDLSEIKQLISNNKVIKLIEHPTYEDWRDYFESN